MKKLYSILNPVCSLILTCCLLAGCGASSDVSADTTPVNIAFVLGIRNNTPAVDTRIDELRTLPAKANSTYLFVEDSGSPHVICDRTIPDVSDRGYTEAMNARVQQSIYEGLKDALNNAKPGAPESDITAALSMAVKGLRSKAVEGRENLLVFYTNGLSSSGLIDLSGLAVSRIDPEASASALADKLDLNMDNIRVIWYGIGRGSGDQPDLSAQETANLKRLYESLFKALGAASVEFRDVNPVDAKVEFPEYPVSVVTTEEVSSQIVCTGDTSDPDAVARAMQDGGWLECKVSFQSDSTRFADSQQAEAQLSSLAAYLRETPTPVCVIGTTASAGSAEECRLFSEGRAQAVKEWLVQAGIPGEQIETIGCGYTSIFYEPDRTDTGAWIEEAAARNRSVKILPQTSQLLDHLWDSCGEN